MGSNSRIGTPGPEINEAFETSERNRRLEQTLFDERRRSDEAHLAAQRAQHAHSEAARAQAAQIEAQRAQQQLQEANRAQARNESVPLRRSDVPNYLTDDVKDSLRGRTFASFDSMRSALNRAMAESPEARAKFGLSDRDIQEMRSGRNPHAAPDGHLGKRVKREFEHTRERRDGHPWDDLDNLRLVTPAAHSRKIVRPFYKAADKRPEGG